MEVFTLLEIAAVLWGTYQMFTWWLERGRISQLTDKTVLITGCDTGFGNLLAKRLDQLGLRVFAGCLTETGVAELRQSCSERLQPIQMDVSSSDSIQEAFRVVKEAVGSKGLWGLVNNAGIPSDGVTVDWYTVADYQAILNVNLLGMIDVTRTFLPLLKKSRGRVVNVASVVGRVAGPNGTPYAVSKYGVEAFSDSLRRAMRCFGVRVHILEPGLFQTKLNDLNESHRRLDHAWQRLCPETKKEYGEEYLQTAKQGFSQEQRFLQDPVAVVDAMEHALFATHPRSRYVVGWDARLLFVPVSWLPTDVQDFVARLVVPEITPACCKSGQ